MDEQGTHPVGRAGRVLGPLAGRRVKWAVVAVAVAVSGAFLALGGEAEPVANTAASLPDDAESARAAAVQAGLPSSGVSPAIAVFTREDGEALDDADLAAVGEATGRGLEVALPLLQEAGLDAGQGGAPADGGAPAEGAPGEGAPGGRPAGPQVSEDGTTALGVVPLPADVPDGQLGEVVEELRSALRDGLPDGLQVAVTGGPAFGADIGAVFEGADFVLLGATAGIVAVLLLLTYRSPWLWLVPLTVVGLGDQVAAKLLAVLSRVSDVRADGAVVGIISVLVFGAGTNYALLLIARYREELRHVEDRHEAMRRALGSAAPAVLASGGTVALALLALGLADDPFARSLGYAGATGIVVALAFALLVLPAAMVLFGRRLFWPFVPKVGQADPTRTGFWSKVGGVVTRRPVLTSVASVLLLGVLASGLVSLRVGQAPDEQFLVEPEAVVGQQQLADAFPAGTGEPAVVIASADRADDVAAAVEGVEGVVSVETGEGDGSVVPITVVTDAEPGTEAAFDQVRDLREAATQEDPDALVGGADAEALDARDTTSRDRLLLFPVILAIVLGVLLVLLRSVVAAIVLVLTVVATYVASMGASWLAFDRLLGYPPLAVSTPLLAFLFLVALGVDYNIFLTTRAREEAVRGAPAREAVVTALAVTGGVITSAGVLLAAVFAVLGVLPLVQLAQIGVIVGFGVLLDTVVVRSLLVPALVTLLGERFWWPSHPARGKHVAVEPEPERAAVG